MVFDKLTLFEVHLEDASFGPNVADDRNESDDERPVEDGTGAEDRSGISIGRLVVAGVVLSAIVSILAWKLAGDDEPDVAIDAPEADDDVDVTVED